MNNQDSKKRAASMQFIAELLDAISEASNDRNRRRELEAELIRVRNRVRRKWMRANRLTERPRGFTISSMKPGRRARWDEYAPVSYEHLDHSEFYSTPGGRGKVILAHLYGEGAPNRAKAFAERNGLDLLLPPAQKASWWSPGKATLVCYATPGLKIRWLEEQTNEYS